MVKTIVGIIIIISIALFYLMHNADKSIAETEFDDLFSLEYSYELPDSLGPSSYITALDFNEDNKIVFSEFRTLSIYVLDMKTNALKRIGRKGAGPGEYSMPLDLQISNDRIDFVDEEKPFISTIDFDGKSLEEVKIEFGPAGHSPFVKYDNKYYFLGATYESHFIRDQINNKYFKIPKAFVHAPSDDPPGIIVDSDTIKFMNIFEAKIYKFYPKTKALSAIELTGFQKYNWESRYDQKMTSIEVKKTSLDVHKFLQFQQLTFSARSKYFICTIEPGSDIRNNWNEKWSYYLVNSVGNIDKKIIMKSDQKYVIKSSKEDRVAFVTYDRNEHITYIKLYKIKQI